MFAQVLSDSQRVFGMSEGARVPGRTFERLLFDAFEWVLLVCCLRAVVVQHDGVDIETLPISALWRFSCMIDLLFHKARLPKHGRCVDWLQNARGSKSYVQSNRCHHSRSMQNSSLNCIYSESSKKKVYEYSTLNPCLTMRCFMFTVPPICMVWFTFFFVLGLSCLWWSSCMLCSKVRMALTPKARWSNFARVWFVSVCIFVCHSFLFIFSFLFIRFVIVVGEKEISIDGDTGRILCCTYRIGSKMGST